MVIRPLLVASATSVIRYARAKRQQSCIHGNHGAVGAEHQAAVEIQGQRMRNPRLSVMQSVAAAIPHQR
jgi:hypothetical protein